MRETDEFDDPATRIFGNIARTVSLRNRVGERGRIFPALAIFGLLFLIGAVAWFSYPRERERFDEMNAPVIRADFADFKAAPPEEGGVDIPYRQSTVFDTLRASRAGQDGGRKIESLLPPAEEPLPREKIFAGMKNQLKVEPALKALPEESDELHEIESLLASVDLPEAKIVTRVQPEETIEEKQPDTMLLAPRPSAKPPGTAASAAATEPAAGNAAGPLKAEEPAGRGYFLQLGSLGSPEAARQAWQQFQKSYAAELANLDLHIEKADVGGRGVFYRVQAGPLDEAQARSLCSAISAKRPGGCLVVTH